MRVSLLHNSRSGSKDHTADDLVATIRDCGHEVVGVAHSLEELSSALRRDATELIAIAGGDGTASRAACALAGSRLPMAIVPLGTANNTARALGIQGSSEEIVRSWGQARIHDFDLIDARTDGNSSPFAEAMGWGVFPRVIAEAKRRQAADEERSLRAERDLFRTVLADFEPRRYEVNVDGFDRSGDYLLVEITNVRFVGPQLDLSPSSSSDDGRLEVTLWGATERELLRELLETGELPKNAPSAQRANMATVNARDALRHVDGHLVDLEREEPRETDFSVHRAAVRYLVG